MAPHQVNSQLSEHNARILALEARMNANTETILDSHESIEQLDKAVFGDRREPDKQPGLYARMKQLETKVDAIHVAVNRVAWMIITAFVAGLLALVFKH